LGDNYSEIDSESLDDDESTSKDSSKWKVYGMNVLNIATKFLELK
jgi:hypothetical protein